MINQDNNVTNLLNWLVPGFLWTDPRLSDSHQEGASETPDPNLFKKTNVKTLQLFQYCSQCQTTNLQAQRVLQILSIFINEYADIKTSWWVMPETNSHTYQNVKYFQILTHEMF